MTNLPETEKICAEESAEENTCAEEASRAEETPCEMPNPKTARRRDARELRDAMPAAFRAEASMAICQKLFSMALFGLCDTVFCYSPVGSEVDIRPFIAEALARGKRVALPVCDYESGDMEFYTLGDGTLTENGPMRIPEPIADPARLVTPTQNTMMLVPGLLFDCRGRRIGYGKGMYDRYIRRFPDFLRGSTAIGVAFDAFVSDTPIPHTDYDVNLALVVTERGIRFTRKVEKAAKWEVRQRRPIPLLDRDGNPLPPRKIEFHDAAYVSPNEGKYAPPSAKETKA